MRSYSVEGDFRHEPLSYHKQQIRAIRLIVDSDFEEIHCNLSVVDLNTHYHALSYVWGEDVPSKPIYINGKRLLVRRNLFDFLTQTKRRVATRHHCCSIWFIDAICIDQENIRERNHQVRQMADIYRSAVSVTSWLGTGDDSMVEFLKIADLIGRHRRVIAKNCQRGRLPVIESDISTFLEQTIPEKFRLGLMRFCDANYWTRLWIVPEYILPGSIHVAYGNNVFDGPMVLGVLQNFRDNPAEQLKQYGQVVKQSRLNVFLDHGLENTLSTAGYFEQSLANLICFYGVNKCSDPRDRVFALTCLDVDYESDQIDYSMSREQLFLQTIDNHLEKMGGAEILGFAHHLATILGLDLLQASLEDFTRLLPDDSQPKNQSRPRTELHAWDIRDHSTIELRLDGANISLETAGKRVLRLRYGQNVYCNLTQPCYIDSAYLVTNRQRPGTHYSHDFFFDTALGVIELLLVASKTKWVKLLNCSRVRSDTSRELEGHPNPVQLDIEDHYSQCSAVDSSHKFGRPWYACSYRTDITEELE